MTLSPLYGNLLDKLVDIQGGGLVTKEPLVSILTPTYRHATVLSQCIESVLAQTYGNWEQIIIDDGSDDGTLAVAKEFAQKDHRIRVISCEHRGIDHLADTYNRGLLESHGELIAILEGDDTWPQRKLEIQVRAHMQDDSLIMSHGITDIMRDHMRIGEYSRPQVAGNLPSTAYLCMALNKRSSIMPVSVMIKTDALERVGGFSQPKGFAAVDYPTFLNLFQLDGNVEFIESVLGHWRQSDTQVTQNHGMEIAEMALEIALNVYDSMSEEDRQAIGTRNGVIDSHFRSTLSDSYLAEMRSALVRKNRKRVRYCAGKLLERGDAKRRVEALVGIAFSGIGANMEWIFHLAQ